MNLHKNQALKLKSGIADCFSNLLLFKLAAGAFVNPDLKIISFL
jgi:hypothetical protein